MTARRDDFHDVPILAELGRLVERAAHAGVAGAQVHTPASRTGGSSHRDRWPRRARMRRGMGALALTLSVGVTVAVVAIVISLNSGASPRLSSPGGSGGPPPDPSTAPGYAQVWRYVAKARMSTGRHDRACLGVMGRPTRRRAISNGQPSPAMLAAFAIFRRPEQPTDRPPRGFATGAGGASGIYIHYVRRAQYRYGGGYYLIPAANVNAGMGPLPARCYGEQTAAFYREQPQIPPRLRQRAERIDAEALAYERYRQAHPAGICLSHLNNKGFGGGGCGATFADTEQHPGLGMSEGDSQGGWINAGIVPNGIASITYRYAKARHSRAFTITVPVINNLVVYKTPRGVSISAKVSLTLKSANGTVIRTLPAQ